MGANKKASLGGFGDPAGTRTQGPNIKSVVLYQLSYEINLLGLFKGVQKYSLRPFMPKVFRLIINRFLLIHGALLYTPGKPISAFVFIC